MEDAILALFRTIKPGTIVNLTKVKDGLRCEWQNNYKDEREFHKKVAYYVKKLAANKSIEETEYKVADGRTYKKWKPVSEKTEKFPEIKQAIMYYMYNARTETSVDEIVRAICAILKGKHDTDDTEKTHRRVTAILYSWSLQKMKTKPWTEQGGNETYYWLLTSDGRAEIERRGYHHKHATYSDASQDYRGSDVLF